MFDEYGAESTGIGYNPDFVARVQRKREEERREELARRASEARLARQQEKERRQEHDEMLMLREQWRRTQAKIEASQALDGGTTLTANDIIAIVAEKHGVSVGEIKGPRRNRDLIVARHEAMWEVKRLKPHFSMPQIGRIFGNRDHTTVLSALKKMQTQQAA